MLVDSIVRSGQNGLNFKDQAMAAIRGYGSELRALANLVIDKFGKAQPESIVLSESDLDTLSREFGVASRNLRFCGTQVHNMTDKTERSGRRIRPGSELGNYLFTQLQDLPALFRRAERLQKEYYKRTGDFNRPDYSLPDDRRFEHQFILPFQYDQSSVRQAVKVPRRRLGERLAERYRQWGELGRLGGLVPRVVHAFSRRVPDLSPGCVTIVD